jgi:hypothetical protein
VMAHSCHVSSLSSWTTTVHQHIHELRCQL